MKFSTLVLTVALTAAAGCTTAPPAMAPAASGPAATGALQPMVVGWQQYFKLSWTSEQRNGAPVVSGRIFNDGGFPAANVRLLVEGLDPAGGVIEQRLGWLGTNLTPGTTSSFEVPLARPAATYRVSVFSFDWIQHDL